MWPYYAAAFLLFMSPLLRARITWLSQMVHQPVVFFPQLEFKCISSKSKWPHRGWLSQLHSSIFFCVMQDLLDNNNGVGIQANIVFQRCLSHLSSLSQLPVAYSASVNDCNGFETVLSVYFNGKKNNKPFKARALRHREEDR